MDIFSKKIILVDEKFETKQEALVNLANEFVENDIGTEEFPSEILKREQIYPTGLPLGNINVAIPHVDSKYVKEDQIGFMSLSTPVDFQMMTDNKEIVPVSMIFMLGLSQSDHQLMALEQLMNFFQNEDKLIELYNTKDSQEVLKILDSIFE